MSKSEEPDKNWNNLLKARATLKTIRSSPEVDMNRILRTRKRFMVCAILFIGSISFLHTTSAQERKVSPGQAGGPIEFNRDIRPILSENCFVCHGPDEGQRKAKLRLDTRDGGIAKLRGGGQAIVPGKASESKLIQRILAEDAAERMPPVKSNKTLTPSRSNC